MEIDKEFKEYCLRLSEIIIDEFREKEFDSEDQEKVNLEANLIKVTISKATEKLKKVKETKQSPISVSDDFLIYTICKDLPLFWVYYDGFNEKVDIEAIQYNHIVNKWKKYRKESLENLGIEKYFNTEDEYFNNNAYYWHLALRDKQLFSDINIPFEVLSEYLAFKSNWTRPLFVVENLNKKINHYDLNKEQKLFIYDKLMGLIANEEYDIRELLSNINIEILNARMDIEPMEVNAEQYDIEEIIKESKKLKNINEQITYLKKRKLKYEQEAEDLGWDIGLGKEIDIEIEHMQSILKEEKTTKTKNITTLTDDLVTVCSHLQGLNKTIKENENSRNSFIARNLCNLGYDAKDQTNWGASESGKSIGEVDIKIEDKDKRAIAIIEAMNLSNLDNSKIKSHLDKIFDYDPNGVSKNYIVVYSNSENFIMLWQMYLTFVNNIEYKYKLEESISEVIQNMNSFSDIKIALGEHNRNNSKTELIHVLVNMNLK